MPLQNRVLPTGDIVADAVRGTMMGNRGILHGADRRLGVARWRHPHWVTCVLSFKGRTRPLMAPGAYTELFFLDEAAALAAGHRPCGECRRAALEHFRAAWHAAHGNGHTLKDIDRHLHRDRVSRNRQHIRFTAGIAALPSGVFVLQGGVPCLVWNDQVLPFTPAGYGAPAPRGTGMVTVLTPACTCAMLAAGYRPTLHPSASVTG